MAAVEGGLTEAACEPEHTVAGLTNGTTLALDGGTLTVSDGTIATTYVALDSLPRVPDPELDGTWVIAGAEFSITGDSAQTAQGSEDLAVAVGRGIAAEPIEAWPYDVGWILGTGDAYLQLLPSDLPYGVDPVVTTGELEAGEEALITGTVALERGCLVLVTGDRLQQVVWQPGTAWDPSSSQVVLPDGVFVPRGSQIEAGGGYHAIGDLTFFGVDAEGIETISRCADLVGDEIAVIQSPASPVPTNPSG